MKRRLVVPLSLTPYLHPIEGPLDNFILEPTLNLSHSSKASVFLWTLEKVFRDISIVKQARCPHLHFPNKGPKAQKIAGKYQKLQLVDIYNIIC